MRLVLVLLLLISTAAIAQQRLLSPAEQACQSMLMEATGRQIEVRTELFTLTREIERLRKENAELSSKLPKPDQQ